VEDVEPFGEDRADVRAIMADGLPKD
jgi:hypothetical protein